MDRPGRISDAIIVDEIGIEYGRYGPYVLKSAYQKIFLADRGLLRPFGVEGLVVPYLQGSPLPPKALFEAADPEDELFIESMCRALHLRNYRNIGVDGLTLFFNFDPRTNSDFGITVAELDLMARRLGEIELESRLLVCEITESEAQNTTTLLDIAAEMRRHGIRIAIDDFGAGHSNMERIELIRPEIVKIDGSWFRQLVAVAGAEGLFRGLVAGLRQLGAQVLVEGIETPTQLQWAAEAGADYFQGYLLSRPQLAGADFDMSARSAEAIIEPHANVVRLFK
jgi:EAL domain-containing protein (putative c-di-GMP-specific phosphodiesterase class I)